MTADQYLYGILANQAVDTSSNSPVLGVRATVLPTLLAWAGNLLLSVEPSGSFAKGTANRSGTDIDLFVSLSPDTTVSLKDIYNSLFDALTNAGFAPRRQNVSINVRIGGYDVDLVPAKKQDKLSDDHSLYRRRADTWTKTNVSRHISYVRSGQRIAETRILKLWRNQKGLDFPSFYLELTVINALQGTQGTLSSNVWKVFQYLRDSLGNARVVDPANTNNVISDDLSAAEKTAIRNAAATALSAKTWAEIIK
jgi:hypothetical protein